jgi:Calx-beta domain
MTIKVTSTSLSSLSNTATVSSTTPDPNSANNAATEPTTVSVPSVSIGDVSVNEGNSGTTLAGFPVTLSPASTVPVTVHYATTDGTATVANRDYAAASGKLTIPAGQTTGSINVKVKGDITIEPDETFTVGLSAPTDSTIGTPTGTGTIVNDDFPADLEA